MAEKITLREWAEEHSKLGGGEEPRYLKEYIAGIDCRFERWPSTKWPMQLGLLEGFMAQVRHEIELMGLWDTVLKSGAYHHGPCISICNSESDARERAMQLKPKGDG